MAPVFKPEPFLCNHNPFRLPLPESYIQQVAARPLVVRSLLPLVFIIHDFFVKNLVETMFTIIRIILPGIPERCTLIPVSNPFETGEQLHASTEAPFALAAPFQVAQIE